MDFNIKIPSDNNSEQWYMVTEDLKKFAPVFADANTATLNVARTDTETNVRSNIQYSEAINAKAYQRSVIALLGTNNASITSLPVVEYSDEQVTSSKSLPVAEDELVLICQRCNSLQEEAMHIISKIVILPTLCQLNAPLSHPCLDSVSQLTAQAPLSILKYCVAPALQYSSSPNCFAAINKLLSVIQSDALVNSLPNILTSLSSRTAFEDNIVFMLESICRLLSGCSHDTSGILPLLITTVSRVCECMPSNSNSVGKLLLQVLKLLSTIEINSEIKGSMFNLVDKHSSALKKALLANYRKLN